MSKCECSPGVSAQFNAAFLGEAGDGDNALEQALREEFGEGEDLFVFAADELDLLGPEELEADIGEGTQAEAELALVDVEDEAAAMDELHAALVEGETIEPNLDDLLAIAKGRPGLKITFSY